MNRLISFYKLCYFNEKRLKVVQVVAGSLLQDAKIVCLVIS